ncbi:hypothetical protein KORDIASMS9_00799 [Kordia sp. SMS9]|uniref:hypothetical protein n=1 Tax=Kordia sp. SMS9 TaxID=2282170 RepID=UPI000E0D7F00|nr:hypothetical protein [Kordia sp. SMS9]AXG68584.1 hypothetical protein KORDIASMS9_00799 [Kordia sp. SMS9]
MKRIIVCILVGITFFACKDEEQGKRIPKKENQAEYFEKNKLNVPKKGALKSLTATQKKLVQDWLEFKTVHESMKLINNTTRFSITEDLGQLAANIEEVDKKKFPKELDVMQIRSRFLVLKTKALKLQDDATDESISNDFIEQEIVEMNNVFHSVCYQVEQATLLNMEPEEILGDLFKSDSTEVEKIDRKTAPIPKRNMVPTKRSTKRFKKTKTENN